MKALPHVTVEMLLAAAAAAAVVLRPFSTTMPPLLDSLHAVSKLFTVPVSLTWQAITLVSF